MVVVADAYGRSRLDRAILRYNPSQEYLTAVKAKAAMYGQPTSGAGGMCPVAGPVEFRDDFGEPRSDGRTHQGNDLFAAYGTPLLAIDDGRIAWTNPADDSIGGIGLDLRTVLGEDWYYAHLSALAVEPGQQVTAGQVIGWVGDPGNATGGPSHLHIERRGDGQVVNPFLDLDRRCLTTPS